MSDDAGGIPEANFLRTAFFTTALRTAFLTAALRTAFLATTFRTAFFAADFFAGFFLAADFFAVFLVAAFGIYHVPLNHLLSAQFFRHADARAKVHSF